MPFPSITHTVGRARLLGCGRSWSDETRSQEEGAGALQWATGERALRSQDLNCSFAPQILGPEIQVFVAGNGSSWVLHGPHRTVLGRSGRSVSPGGRDYRKQEIMRFHVGPNQACGPRTPTLCEAYLCRGFAPWRGALSVRPSSFLQGVDAISRTLGDTDGARAASASGLDFSVILRCGRLWSFPPAPTNPSLCLLPLPPCLISSR